MKCAYCRKRKAKHDVTDPDPRIGDIRVCDKCFKAFFSGDEDGFAQMQQHEIQMEQNAFAVDLDY